MLHNGVERCSSRTRRHSSVVCGLVRVDKRGFTFTRLAASAAEEKVNTVAFCAKAYLEGLVVAPPLSYGATTKTL